MYLVFQYFRCCAVFVVLETLSCEWTECRGISDAFTLSDLPDGHGYSVTDVFIYLAEKTPAILCAIVCSDEPHFPQNIFNSKSTVVQWVTIRRCAGWLLCTWFVFSAVRRLVGAGGGPAEGGGRHVGGPLQLPGGCYRSGRVGEALPCAVSGDCRLGTSHISTLKQKSVLHSEVSTPWSEILEVSDEPPQDSRGRPTPVDNDRSRWSIWERNKRIRLTTTARPSAFFKSFTSILWAIICGNVGKLVWEVMNIYQISNWC